MRCSPKACKSPLLLGEGGPGKARDGCGGDQKKRTSALGKNVKPYVLAETYYEARLNAIGVPSTPAAAAAPSPGRRGQGRDEYEKEGR